MATAEAMAGPAAFPARLPPWIRIRPPQGPQYSEVRELLEGLHLETVCREARCPNLPECWSAGTATLMLLGTDCTRRCGFCAVTTRWPRGVVDRTEPERVATAVERWGLRYVVLTQVCRDDLPDGGASILSETVDRIHRAVPSTKVELLAGDLGGSESALRVVLGHPPEVFAHNIETVRSLSPRVRDPRAGYDRSLQVLSRARSVGGSRLVTKTSIMLGLGEAEQDLETTLRDLRSAGVDLVTFGQYLAPGPKHTPVVRYLPPGEFSRWKERALDLGFAGVEAGPLVRSSYHAEELFDRAASGRT
ncbi:MAG: lipoyl synthase [Thermoplasmata archaeon]|nr:lipoyl synthase [Thermoplasmata archaeon]